jgi:hypothetical protein
MSAPLLIINWIFPTIFFSWHSIQWMFCLGALVPWAFSTRFFSFRGSILLQDFRCLCLLPFAQEFWWYPLLRCPSVCRFLMKTYCDDYKKMKNRKTHQQKRDVRFPGTEKNAPSKKEFHLNSDILMRLGATRFCPCGQNFVHNWLQSEPYKKQVYIDTVPWFF